MLREDHAAIHVFAVTDRVARRVRAFYARHGGRSLRSPLRTSGGRASRKSQQKGHGMSNETPEADAVEQRTEVRTRDGGELPTHLDTESADEGDAVEQALEVPLDEEDDEALQDGALPGEGGEEAGTEPDRP
jgi:hypothetical protein